MRFGEVIGRFRATRGGVRPEWDRPPHQGFDDRMDRQRRPVRGVVHVLPAPGDHVYGQNDEGDACNHRDLVE